MGGHKLNSNSTAKAIVRVRGPDVTYGVLKFTPQIDSRAHSFDVTSFSIRRGNDRYLLSDLPLAKALPHHAREDIVYHTFEADSDERTEYHEIDFEITEYDEVVRLLFRAVEHKQAPDLLFYEVEDQSGDWLPVEDLLLVDLMPDSFMRILEASAIDNITEHNLDRLPMSSES